jgi:hypothetical protein
MSATGFGGYGMQGYGNLQSSGNTQPYGIIQPYGDPGVSMTPQAYTASPQPSPEEQRLSRLLTASGVPHDGSRLRWPLGLRILAAPASEALRDQVDACFAELAQQPAGSPTNAALAQAAQQAVNEFRRLLRKDKAERFGMPLAVYEESERFLSKVNRAGQLLAAGGQGGSPQGRTDTPASPGRGQSPP